MARMLAALLATLALLPVSLSIITTSAVGFVASDKSVTFALNIPQADDNEDLYFTLSGPSSSSWIALGMGSVKMDNSLMFMMYENTTGGVTVSPRLADGNTEPEHTKDVSIDLQIGTGVRDGIMTANVICQKCRSWKGGKIDPANTKAAFVFATGPNESLKSNDLSKSVKRHSNYGAFTMDLTRAVGAKTIPIASMSVFAGTTELSNKGDRDLMPPFHAVLMIFAFVGFMPLAVVILRVLNRPAWHGIAQSISVVIALIGVGLGFYLGTLYNRTRDFKSAHQVFGVIVIIAMVGQFVIGALHHRMYSKNGSSKLAPVHIWLGRFVIPAGIINGFLGFPLALNPKYNWALGSLILLIVIVAGPFVFWRYKRNARKQRTEHTMGMNTGYQARPWQDNSRAMQSDVNLGHMQNYPLQYHTPEEGRQFV